jgi:hypothetical protein
MIIFGLTMKCYVGVTDNDWMGNQKGVSLNRPLKLGPQTATYGELPEVVRECFTK